MDNVCEALSKIYGATFKKIGSNVYLAKECQLYVRTGATRERVDSEKAMMESLATKQDEAITWVEDDYLEELELFFCSYI